MKRRLLVGLLNKLLDVIAESDEDAEADDEEETEPFSIADIPQAFSHFTYRYTKHKLLVLSTSPPLFELTDPVIHFMEKRVWTDRPWL